MGIEWEYPGPHTGDVQDIFKEKGYTMQGSHDPEHGREMPPVPPYTYTLSPGQRSTPGGKPELVGRDPEEQFEREPITHSPTRIRTRPFLPGLRDPEYPPTPLLPTAEIIQYEPVPEVRYKPVEHIPEQPRQPAPTQLPEGLKQKPVVEPASEVERKPVVEASPPSLSSTTGMRHKPVQKSTDPVEKVTDAGGKATGGGKMKKLEEEYDGEMGRKHTEEQIEEILDVYLQTGLLPTYVTQKMRWLYKHHRRLPQRRELLEQAGKQIVIPEVGGDVHNITPIQRAEVHHRKVSS
jgi:hypothetical protein